MSLAHFLGAVARADVRHVGVSFVCSMEHIFRRSEDPLNLMRQVLLDKGARHTMCAPLMSGMRLSGSGPVVEMAGRVWGEHAGIALQAMDDVADLIGNFVTTGKDTFQDFRDGRLSLLLFLLWERTPADKWQEISSFMSRGGDTVLMPHERKVRLHVQAPVPPRTVC